MKKLFIHNTVFRVITPLLYGVLVYVLILLINDSVESLSDNFINQEVLFCITLTYLVVEVFRVQILVLDKYLPIKESTFLRILLQISFGILLAYFISSLVISIYFQYILDYSRYDTELLTFNIIYVVSAILFNMIYISVSYLNMENGIRLQEEEIKRKNLEYQMKAFNNEINPGFLYSSLETLIGLLYENEEDSEVYIEKLSTVYRYILSNKNNELVTIEVELGSTEALIYVLNTKYNQQIRFNQNLDSWITDQYLVPGTMNIIIEKIVNMTIITKRQPLIIKCYCEDDYLVFQTKLNERLTHSKRGISHSLKDPYEYFSIKPIIELKAQGDLYVKVPMLNFVDSSEMVSA